jgi:transposase
MYILPSSHRDRGRLERRRLQAAKLFAKGHTQAEVARKLEVSREAVRKWHAAWTRNGSQGLYSTGKPGPKPRLASERFKEIERILARGPAAYGFSTQLWTLGRIATVMKKALNVKYGTTRIWQILLSMHWTCQKPETRAAERNEAAIRAWKKITWPRIKKKQAAWAQN